MRLLLAGLAAFGHVALAAFTPLSANQTFSRMIPGWNLGNTLDALPTEGSWNNPPVQNVTFSQIYAEGFRSVRIPITFVNHFVSDAPNYTIDATWLARINYVVDAAVSTGLFVVVNVHHDSWNWADVSGDKPDLDARKLKFEKTWAQLAGTLKDKSERVVFESLNEPVGTTQADANQLNDLNLRFLNVVRNSGGNNAQRVVSLPGLNDNSVHLTEWFVPPNSYTSDKWSVQFHYYSPWDFISNSWGRTFWGSDADKAAVLNDLLPVRGNFSVPILMGEYSPYAIGSAIEKAAGWAWCDFVTRTAVSLGIVPQWWDNGADYFDRTAGEWRDVTTKNILLAAATGKINTIPYNGNGTLWLQANVTTPPPIYLQYNGNTLKGIYTPAGAALTAGKDYTVVTSPLTGFALTSSYIASLGSSSTLGEIGRVIVKSNNGANLEIDIRRYTRPTVSTGTVNVSGNTNDYYINFTPNGAKLATVKAVGPSGEIVKDDWTVWLGDLQAGRINWGSDFIINENSAVSQLVIYSSFMTTIKNFGKPVTLTWEFWPRSDRSNNVTTVVTVT
ncbi:Glycoside hydrolase family 5 protein [Ceratobasidium theobromae]|uniref:Glycoside hydrolase family 5 protein n=1 Tax=Ceratobasidium theobromae TaxID=1582974 RepID=A0A5N5QWL6_9AGAM|nr:Glycoside hydrolase family 5 protein [Ceratobasidium theobromae]